MNAILVLLGILFIFVAALAIGAAIAAIPAAIIWYAYGAVAVDAFHAPALSYWQVFLGTWALCCIGRALFSHGSSSSKT